MASSTNFNRNKIRTCTLLGAPIQITCYTQASCPPHLLVFALHPFFVETSSTAICYYVPKRNGSILPIVGRRICLTYNRPLVIFCSEQLSAGFAELYCHIKVPICETLGRHIPKKWHGCIAFDSSPKTPTGWWFRPI